MLRGALFEGADLRGVMFARCDLTNADLQGTNLRGADLRGSLLDGLRIGPKDVQGAIIDPSQAVQVAGLLGLTVKAIAAWKQSQRDLRLMCFQVAERSPSSSSFQHPASNHTPSNLTSSPNPHIIRPISTPVA